MFALSDLSLVFKGFDFCSCFDLCFDVNSPKGDDSSFLFINPSSPLPHSDSSLYLSLCFVFLSFLSVSSLSLFLQMLFPVCFSFYCTGSCFLHHFNSVSH